MLKKSGEMAVLANHLEMANLLGNFCELRTAEKTQCNELNMGASPNKFW